MERLQRIKELMTQKTTIDAELKTLQEQVEKESAALKKPRQPRKRPKQPRRKSKSKESRIAGALNFGSLVVRGSLLYSRFELHPVPKTPS